MMQRTQCCLTFTLISRDRPTHGCPPHFACEGPCGAWKKPLTLTLSQRERGPKRPLEPPLQRLQRRQAHFASDLLKLLDDLLVEWDPVLPPLAFFLVFQESGIQHTLLACGWLGLPQPFKHLVHILFKSVDL